jgi:hypothetical protein
VKSSLVAPRVLFVSMTPLLLFGIATLKLPALAVAQPPVLHDVKHNTPGRVIKQGHPIFRDSRASWSVSATHF